MPVTFTVDRSTWLRGEGMGNSFLLRKADGKMCCLGFRCLALGASREEITDVGLPSTIQSDRTGLIPEWLEPELHEPVLHGAHVPEEVIAEINDDQSLSDASRERQLTSRFAECGDTVIFTGEVSQ